jgi:hypothetical protein
MVRDMMLEAVESRFAAIQAPHALEWLTESYGRKLVTA